MCAFLDQMRVHIPYAVEKLIIYGHEDVVREMVERHAGRDEIVEGWPAPLDLAEDRDHDLARKASDGEWGIADDGAFQQLCELLEQLTDLYSSSCKIKAIGGLVPNEWVHANIFDGRKS